MGIAQSTIGLRPRDRQGPGELSIAMVAYELNCLLSCRIPIDASVKLFRGLAQGVIRSGGVVKKSHKPRHSPAWLQNPQRTGVAPQCPVHCVRNGYCPEDTQGAGTHFAS